MRASFLFSLIMIPLRRFYQHLMRSFQNLCTNQITIFFDFVSNSNDRQFDVTIYKESYKQLGSPLSDIFFSTFIRLKKCIRLYILFITLQYLWERVDILVNVSLRGTLHSSVSLYIYKQVYSYYSLRI